MLTFIKSFNIHPPTASADNVPDAVNWGDIIFYVSANYGTITSKQITGISSSIDLNVTDFVTNPDIAMYYQVSNSEVTGTITGAPSSPWISIDDNPGTTFSVSNNQWVSFCCYGTAATKNADTVSVYNASDSNSLLDTFTADIDA